MSSPDVRIALVKEINSREEKAKLEKIISGQQKPEYEIVLEDEWYIFDVQHPTKKDQKDPLTHDRRTQEHFRHFYIRLDNGIEFGEVGKTPYLNMLNEEKTALGISHIGFTTHNTSGIQFSSYEFLDGEVLPDPIRQLFLFALLNKYYDMARYFWEEGDEHVAAALMASKLYESIAKTQNSEVQETLHQQARKFEDMAYDILTECEDQSEGEDTYQMLLNKSPRWGYLNHLQLAELAGSLKFLSHPAVLRLLDRIWEEGIPEDEQDDEEGYAVVKFLKEENVDVVSTSWLTEDCKACWWPPFSDPKAATRAVKHHLPHDIKTWSTHSVQVLRREGE
ncbi:transient receptor potential cation channel subfamily M member 8-like [Amphiura filiformis]|uniref:transient receptor potential cation channel subfamily M member 8-like n=1 Tax=Amphiura filiformis TaxID=82378 RepID=UPI003B2187EE